MRINAYLRVALLLFAASAHAAEWLVGVQLPLSGGLARVGGEMERGITAAAADFNQTQSRHRIRLLVQDDESAPAKAVSAVERLASQGAVAIVGGYSSNIVAPASESADRLGLVYLTSGGISQNLSQRGLSHFFRISNNQGYARTVTLFLAELKAQSVAVLYSTRDASQELARLIRERSPARNTTLYPFDPKLQDFKPLVNKLRLQDKAEVMIMVGYEQDYVGILRAARVLKPPVKAIFGVLGGMTTPQMASDFPELVNNVLGSAMMPYPPRFASEGARRFAASFRSLYRRDPDQLNQIAYVQGQILFEAIARAADKGSLRQPGGLVAELRATRRDTLIGPVSFDANGDNPNFTQYIGQHQGNGRVELVSPRQKATGKLNLPAVPW